MVTKLSVALEHCYGIKKLDATFDFTKTNAYAVYAPNGAMKSSLAHTFQDVANGAQSRDRVFPGRVSMRKIADETGADIAAEDILVVLPYDVEMGHTARTSTLLVNSALRKEYETLHLEIDEAKAAFLKAMKEQSGSKRDLEQELSLAITSESGKLFIALTRLSEELAAQTDAPFATLNYDIIFDEKVLEFLNTKDFKNTIAAYITKYNELLAASTYFRKGTFNYYNASTIAKSLADNGFFRAKHSIRLNADTVVEIKDAKELEAIIKAEKDAISNDAELKKQFAEIGKLLEKNAGMRGFEAYIADNDGILPKLANAAAFKQEVWKSYIRSHFNLYTDLLEKYKLAQKRKEEIEAQAAAERTQWENVIDIFNDRFFVPFKLEAQNKIDVMLGQQPVLKLGFTFEDGNESAPVQRDALIQVLSTGEKKAFYILQIIFEIEARKAASQKTILVVDDIADSFDYRNKYAIIQYLREIADSGNFFEILLTHNFDFFRTVHSRFVSYAYCLMVVKTNTEITLTQASGIKNIFVNDWKPNFATDAKKRVASIPFMRNLVEFTKGDADPAFIKLTSLLHWKADSRSITEADLFGIYSLLFGVTVAPANGQGVVVDLIHQEAAGCLGAGDGLNFENKIVLSIAIRLLAEEFMATRINDSACLAGISTNQTSALLREFRSRFAQEGQNLKVMEKVVLMTPENIHLNSFMYEPILDMSDEHLRRLYGEVQTLQ
jgi:hypothetical protein